MTLLEIVQDVLDMVGLDQVNDISATEHAEMAARNVRRVYDELLTRIDIRTKKTLLKVEALSDSSLPNYLKLPTKLDNLEYFRYNVQTADETSSQFKTIPFVMPEEFLERTSTRNDTDSNIKTVTDPTGVELFIRDDRAAQYWTTFDDVHMVFDAYDKEVDDAMQESKTLAYGEMRTDFQFTNDYLLPLEPVWIIYVREEAANKMFALVKQSINSKLNSDARAAKVAAQRNKSRVRVNPLAKAPNFARKGSQGNSTSRNSILKIGRN